jgi:type VI protein secretion system component Hcp
VLKTVRFEFLKTSADGQEEVSDVITLTSATVSHFKRTVAEDTRHADAGRVALDEITLTFQKIQFDNTGGKTTALDDWHR